MGEDSLMTLLYLGCHVLVKKEKQNDIIYSDNSE
jgi:hypothetical protein